jgi:hypothetical protein
MCKSEAPRRPLSRITAAVVAISLWLAELSALFAAAYILIGAVVDEILLSAAVAIVALVRRPIRRWLEPTPWTF